MQFITERESRVANGELCDEPLKLVRTSDWLIHSWMLQEEMKRMDDDLDLEAATLRLVQTYRFRPELADAIMPRPAAEAGAGRFSGDWKEA